MSSVKATSDLQQFTISVQRTLAVLQRLEIALQDEQTALAGTVPEQLEMAVHAKIGVLGLNGSGKSTLLRAVMGAQDGGRPRR